MIAATCPTCGKTTNCPDELAGSTVPCSGCGTNLTVGAAGGMGGYGGYGATQQPARSKSSGSPWFFKGWILALGGLAAIGLVGGLVYLISPKPKPQAVAENEEPDKSKSADDKKSADKKGEEPGESTDEKPAKSKKGLVISPLEAITLEAGSTAKVTIKIERGGTKDAIALQVENLPDQVTFEQAAIEEGKDSAVLVLTAAPEAQASAAPAKIKIIAEAGESRAESEVAVTIKPPPPPVLSTIAALTIRPGATAPLEVKVDRKGYMEPIQLVFEGLPDKVTAGKTVAAPEAAGQETAGQDAAGQDAAVSDLTIPAEDSSLKITLTAAADAVDSVATPRVTATVREQKIETPLKLTVERYSYRVQPLPVITLKPGETKTIDVVVDRRSYTGPLKLEPIGLPEKVTATAISMGENQTKAELKVAAAGDAAEQVKSAALSGKANEATVNEALVIRISKGEGSFLPAEISGDAEPARVQKRNTMVGRSDTASRQMLLKAYGGTAESEAVVLKGLAWLAKQQREEGIPWSFEVSGNPTGDAAVEAQPTGEVKELGVAATALALLPFLGAGVTHEQSPSEPAVLKEYRPKVFRALGWIGQTQIPDRRDPRKDGELPGGLYAHALGTIALCEAYALSKDDRMKFPSQRAVKYLVQSQHSDGGWGHAPQQPGDLFVVAWVLQALRSGQQAGVSVDKSTLEKAGKFLNACAAGPDDAKFSRYGDTPGAPVKAASTAAGLLCRQYQGWERDNPDLSAGCKYLLENLPPESGSLYYAYYATQVLHHLEGENWDKWNHRVREHLIRTQQKDGPAEGSWSPAGTDFGNQYGTIYATSLALLTLEEYYRQLPIYRPAVKVAGAK